MRCRSDLILVGFFLFGSIYTNTAFAQLSEKAKKLVPVSQIKISPLHLVSFYPTLQVAYEQKIANVSTLQLDGGYVVRQKYPDNRYKDKRGFKLKLAYRNYFEIDTLYRRLFYFAAEGYVNHVDFDRGMQEQGCLDAQCNHTFIRFTDYTVKYREKGIALKVGEVKYFGRFFFDVSVGLSLRFIRYVKREADNDWWFPLDPFSERDRVIPFPDFGVRFGYRLK